MARYLEAFFRHKVLLITPVVIALVMSLWYITSQPATYQASTTMWVDSALPNPSSIDVSSQGPTPAQQAQTVLQELLGSRKFLVKVGHRGPLAAYLTAHAQAKHGPSAVVSSLKSTILGRSAGKAALDDRIVATLAKAVAVSAPGPQSLRVSIKTWAGPPIPGTLQAVVDQYMDEVTAVRASRAQASLTYYQSQLTAAQQTVQTANNAVIAYEESHPGATAGSDPQFAQLEQVAFADQNNSITLQNSYNQAALALANAGSRENVRVLDAPLNAAKAGHMKKTIFAAIAAIALGLLISLLATTALVASDQTARTSDDLRDLEGLEVVASLEHVRDARLRAPDDDYATRRTS